MLELSDMAAEFRPRCRREYRLLVGFEYEVFLLDRATLAPLAYEGPRGLLSVLKHVRERVGGTLAQTQLPNKLSFSDGSQLSLEPGGQLEYSSAPVGAFEECLHQLTKFLDLLADIRQRFEVSVFFGGVDPVRTLDEIPLVMATERYRMMDAYFPRVGTMGRRMMRQTASLQVTFDYRDEPLGLQVMRAGSYVAPLAAGLFSNSPFIDGKVTEHRSNRVPVWQDTDPSRCGYLPGAERADYRFEDYVAHVIKAPMFFVRVGDDLIDPRGLTFAQFNQRGFEGRQATMEDFMLHNSTIFTEVRLKHTVEVRSVDAQDPALVPGVLAFMCGLMLCESARTETLGVLSSTGAETGSALADRLSTHGLEVPIGDTPAYELMAELIETARSGLKNCFEDGEQAGRHLDLVADLVERRKTPADVVLERFGNDPRAWLRAGRIFDE